MIIFVENVGDLVVRCEAKGAFGVIPVKFNAR